MAEAKALGKAMNEKAAKEVEFKQAEMVLADLKAESVTFAEQRSAMVKAHAAPADLAALDVRIAANTTARDAAAGRYNTLHDAKVKIEAAEREKKLAIQKKEELEAAKAELVWLQGKLTIFASEKDRLIALLASGKDEKGVALTSVTTASITERKDLFVKVHAGTTQIVLDVKGERTASDEKEAKEATARGEKEEKAALEEKMKQAEMYKTKAEASVTIIADLEAKLALATVAQIRERIETDLKKARADKSKYEGIKANADKEFTAKKGADDAKMEAEAKANDALMNGLLGAETNAKNSLDIAIGEEVAAKEAYETDTNAGTRASKKSTWEAKVGAVVPL